MVLNQWTEYSDLGDVKPNYFSYRVLKFLTLAGWLWLAVTPWMGSARAEDLDDEEPLFSEPKSESGPGGKTEGASAPSPTVDAGANLSYIKGRQFALDGKYEAAAPLLEKALAQSPDDAYLNHQLGEVYLRLGDFDRAEQLSKKAVDKDPSNLDYRANLAGIYAGLKRYDEAKLQYKKILEINPKNKRAPLFLGILEAEQGNFEEGIKTLTASIESNGDSYMAYFYRAKIYLENNDVKNAKKDLNACLNMKPAFVEAGTALGLLHERLGEIDEAIGVYNRIQGSGRFKKRLAQLYLQKNDFEKALEELVEYEKVETDDYTARVKIALIYFELKKYDEAKGRFETILKEQPQADVRFYLAAIYEEQKLLDKALAEFKRVSDGSSFFKDSMLHVGFIYRETNRLKEGIAFADKLVKKNPAIAEFYDLQASLYENKKDYKAAMAAVGKGLERFPTEERLLYFQGALYDKLGERAKAIANMKQIVASNEKNAHALNFLGYTYAEMGENLEEAETLVKKALELRPDDGYILDSLAWVYYKQGNYDKAQKELELAMVKQPEEPVILEHMGDVLLKKKEFELAAANYKKAGELAAAKKDSETSKKLKSKLATLEKEREPTSSKAKN